jgi:hypothetical protein
MLSSKKAILICVVQETEKYLPACEGTTRENATTIFSTLLKYISRPTHVRLALQENLKIKRLGVLIINVSVYKKFTSLIIFIVIPDEGLMKKYKHVEYFGY